MNISDLPFMQVISDMFNDCNKQDSGWLVFRKPQPGTDPDMWCGTFFTPQISMYFSGTWGNYIYRPLPFLPMPRHLHKYLGKYFPHTQGDLEFNVLKQEFLNSKSVLISKIHTKINEGYLPYALQYIGIDTPKDSLSTNIDRLLWSEDICEGVAVSGTCVYKLPSTMRTYKLGYPVDLSKWFDKVKSQV